jgi:hypothetical protein
MRRRGAGLLQLSPPLLLAVLELGHPHGTAADLAALIPIADWWLLLHLLQLPLLWLVAWSVADLLRGTAGPFTTLSRLALLVFAASATVLDALAGIATGLLAHTAAGWPAEQQRVAARQLEALLSGPLIGTRWSLVDLLVATSWLVGLWAAVGALASARRSAVVRGLLAVSGLALWYGGHAIPFGPIAFASVFVARLVDASAGPSWAPVARRSRKASLQG